MAGRDRGNRRCFGVIGRAALLVSDRGPPGTSADVTMQACRCPELAAGRFPGRWRTGRTRRRSRRGAGKNFAVNILKSGNDATSMNSLTVSSPPPAGII